MKTSVIQLESHDDIHSAQDKIAWSQAQRVLLIWPKQATNFGSQLDLILLQRQARQLALQLGFVGVKGEVLSRARELGIPVFSSVGKANRSRWLIRRSRRQLAFPETRLDRAELEQARAEVRLRDDEPILFWQRMAIFSAGVLAVILLAVFFLPGAQVSLSPTEKQQNMVITFRASPQTTEPSLSGAIPAEEISVIVEGQDQTDSSGSVQSPDQYAQGLVVFTNLSELPITIPTKTRVTTGGDQAIEFETTRTDVLPGGNGQAITLPVRASMPGATGNVQMGEIRVLPGQLGLQVRVTNPEETHGGSDQKAAAPDAGDIEAMRQRLLRSLESAALSELQAKLSDYQLLVPGSLQVKSILQEEQDPPAGGSPAQRVTLKMKVEMAAWAVSRQHIEAIAQTALSANLPAGYAVLPGSFRFEAKKPAQFDAQEVAFELDVSRSIKPAWSEQQIVRVLTGKPAAAAAGILAEATGQELTPVIQISPSWWRRMPFLPFRIQVKEN